MLTPAFGAHLVWRQSPFIISPFPVKIYGRADAKNSRPARHYHGSPGRAAPAQGATRDRRPHRPHRGRGPPNRPAHHPGRGFAPDVYRGALFDPRPGRCPDLPRRPAPPAPPLLGPAFFASPPDLQKPPPPPRRKGLPNTPHPCP